jgi:hypothetical protein
MFNTDLHTCKSMSIKDEPDHPNNSNKNRAAKGMDIYSHQRWIHVLPVFFYLSNEWFVDHNWLVTQQYHLLSSYFDSYCNLYV